MKILIDARVLIKGGVSGVEEYTRNLVKALLAADRHNQYILFYNGRRKVPLNFNAPIIDWGIPNKILDLSFRFLNWPKIDSLTKADVIFSPHFNILAVKNRPRIITFHDLSFVHHPYFFSLKQRLWHWLQNIQKQVDLADKIIAVSEFTKQDLIETWQIPAEKIKVVYSGIADEFRPAASSSADYPYILYLGTLEPRKNVVALIKAFNLLKTGKKFANFKLILAGKTGWLYNNIIREAAASPFRRDIIFYGQVNNNDRVKLYSQAQVFVYPSFFEGFGFPPLEAQACGCPVVAAQRTSLIETLRDSALLVNPWSVQDLADAIDAIISDEHLRQKLQQAGLTNAKRFSWQKTAAAMLEIFNTYASKQ